MHMEHSGSVCCACAPGTKWSVPNNSNHTMTTFAMPVGRSSTWKPRLIIVNPQPFNSNGCDLALSPVCLECPETGT